MKQSRSPEVKETLTLLVMHLTCDPKKGKHNLPSIRVRPWNSQGSHFRPESAWFGTGVALLLAKENLLILNENKIRPWDRIPVKFGHQRIVTKQHFEELSVKEPGTCSFNFLPNTHACRFKEKCSIKHVLNCNASKDMESHWTRMGPGFSPSDWMLFLSLGIGLLDLTPFLL